MEIPVHIITLNPKAAPVQKLKGQLAAQGITANLFPGVDGRKEMPPLQEGESINQHRSLEMRMIELTPSEIGCYLSHLRAIKKAYNTGLSRICLLEDDVLVEDTFCAILSEVETLPEEVEFVRLMGLKVHKRKIVSSLGNTHRLTRPVKGLCGTQGYVVNRAGMKKIIERGSEISEPIDKFYDHYWDIDLHSYAIEPHLIWERVADFSTIAKQSRGNATKPLDKRIKKHQVKLSRGNRRRIYMLRHWNEFAGASKPKGKQGRTERIH